MADEPATMSSEPATMSSTHGWQRPDMFWPTSEPPAEFRVLILAVVAITGLPTLALVILNGARDAGTLGAVGVIVGSLLLSIWLVRHGLRSLTGATTAAVLGLAAVALIGAYVLAQNSVTVLATMAPFAFGVAWFRPRWIPAVVGLGAIGVAILAATLLHGERVAGSEIVQMGIYYGAALIGFAGTSIDWQVKRRMDRHHADQNELSLARERLRFATDLHDIQGHTLLAIKMKAELARRSMERDPERVLRELQDIEDLAAQAGDQTRELAHGYRSLTLAAEVANLDQLLSAAGIRVRIDRRGGHAPEHEELFAALVREAASNILRHADAQQVRIMLAPTTVSIRNDGAASPVGEPRSGEPWPGESGRGLGIGPGGSGLTGLERRFQRSGGTVTWQHEGEQFTVTGTVGDHL